MSTNPNITEPQKPRRRWFQFRLRTLLIVMMVAAMFCPLGVRIFRIGATVCWLSTISCWNPVTTSVLISQHLVQQAGPVEILRQLFA